MGPAEHCGGGGGLQLENQANFPDGVGVFSQRSTQLLETNMAHLGMGEG